MSVKRKSIDKLITVPAAPTMANLVNSKINDFEKILLDNCERNSSIVINNIWILKFQ